MTDKHAEKWDRLSESVAKMMEDNGIPGVAVGILHKGKTTTAGFGVTNIDHPLPVTDETLFQIGSITKTFTGTAIMRLVEDGKLNLDARVRTYLPDFKLPDETAASQATIRHLLTHLGGWRGDFFDDTGAGDDALAKYVANMNELEQITPIGTVFSYNNAGFSLAGYVMEKVTGKSYQAALKELALEPLGLNSSYFNPGDIMALRFAVGHNVTGQDTKVALPWPLSRSAYPAGGIICNVHDLLRYARFHLGDGGMDDGTRLLSSESMNQMQSPQVVVWGDEAWGLTWAVDDTGGTRKVSHGGGTMGQISQLMLVPTHAFAIAIFTNANRGGVLTREIVNLALNEYLGLETKDPAPIEASVQELAAYVGRYCGSSDIELGILGGKLVGQLTYKGGFPSKDTPPPPPPPPLSLTLCEKDRLLVLDGPLRNAQADVIRKPDGSIGWLRIGGRIHVREP